MEMQSKIIALGSSGGNVPRGCPLILLTKGCPPSGCCPLRRGEAPWSPHYHDPSSSGLQSPIRFLSQHLLPLAYPFLQEALNHVHSGLTPQKTGGTNMHICVLRSGLQAISSIEKFFSTEVCNTASKMV